MKIDSIKLKNFRKKKGFGRIITYYNYSRICKTGENTRKYGRIYGKTSRSAERRRKKLCGSIRNSGKN